MSLSDSKLSDPRHPQKSFLSIRLAATIPFHPSPRRRQPSQQPLARLLPKKQTKLVALLYGFRMIEFTVIYPQSSMRFKANTFLKQFMGSGSARDKRRALSLTGLLQPAPPSEDAPPVPAIPSNVSSTPVADVFMSNTPSESSVPPPLPSKSTPSGGATIRPRPSKRKPSPHPVVGNEAGSTAS